MGVKGHPSGGLPGAAFIPLKVGMCTLVIAIRVLTPFFSGTLNPKP